MAPSVIHPRGNQTALGQRDWLLPMPCDLSISDSFSNELEQQFDKVRERIWQDKDESNQNSASSSEESVVTPGPVRVEPPSMSPPPLPPVSAVKNKRHSATNLLRRSSAYFKATFDFFKSSRRTDDRTERDLQQLRAEPFPEKGGGGGSDDDNNNDEGDVEDGDSDDSSDEEAENTMIERPPVPARPAKIAINTTIPISRRPGNPRWNMIQPPIITQYPPKPLQYAPVEPLPPQGKKSIAHRISMPALRKQTNAQRRNRSFTDAANRVPKKSKERSS